MSLRLFAMTCGWLEGPLDLFLEGASGRVKVPIPCYLVSHPRGVALFDSGLHVGMQTDPKRYLGRTASVFEASFTEGEEVRAQLARLDVDASRVRFLINSHLHFDHTGGNAQVANAQLIVQRREWEAGHDEREIEARFYQRSDYDLGHDVLMVDGEHDVFGDGSVVCLPTFGHTAGHQALKVALPSGDVVLTADACYFRRSLEEGRLPRAAYDHAAMRRSLDRLRTLRRQGARLFYGHDPDFWAEVPQAPRWIE